MAAIDTLSTSETEALEKLIDSHGLSAVLQAISNVCGEKAEHLETNWQDAESAETWVRAGARVFQVAGKIADNEGL